MTCILDALISPGNHVAELITGLLLLGYVHAGDLIKNRRGDDRP